MLAQTLKSCLADEAPRSGNVGDQADRSCLIQRAPGCFGRSYLRGAYLSPRDPALLLGALGSGGSLGAGGELGDNSPSSSPTEGPCCSGARWGCGKGDRPERRTLRRRRIPPPAPHPEDRWSRQRPVAAWCVYRVSLSSEDEARHLHPAVRGGAG